MAKKQVKMGRPPAEVKSVPVASLKGTPDFKEWFDGLRKHVRLRPSDLIEHALVAYGEQRDYPHPAPDRTQA